MRIRLESLGCRLNTGECERLARQFCAAGHCVVGDGDPFDVCIINTCAVTQIATRKSRQLVRALQRLQPAALFVVTGCYAQLEPDQAAALGVSMVVDNRHKDDIVTLVAARLVDPVPGDDEHIGCSSPLSSGASVSGAQGVDEHGVSYHRHTRAFVKVQDGCDNACTYCVVRLARGAARSQPVDEVLAEVHELVGLGYREVVLSGVHLGSYGHDWNDRHGLHGLVRRLLDETAVDRLRLSSLEPWDLDAGFFDLWQDPRLGRHLHLPLQSGCATTLRRMARRCTPHEYAALAAAARAAIPDLAVTTDVMVGFPGETEAEFAASLAFVEAQGFAHLHVFRFSPRPGTPAASMPDRVPPAVAAARSQQLHALSRQLEHAFRRRFVDRTLHVLWESCAPIDAGCRPANCVRDYRPANPANRTRGCRCVRDYCWDGLTENGLRVLAQGGPGLRNVITPVHLLTDGEDGLWGEIVATGGGE
jgi:threonylcarbamoyladenosine tRNA methylthiotransferase MtaB